MTPTTLAFAALSAAVLTTGPAWDTCAPRRPHPPGPARYTLAQAEVDRAYLVHVPLAYDGGTPLPVVIDLHGSGSHPEQELAISGLDRAADQHGFLVVLPEAAVPMPKGGNTWNVPPVPGQPDDVAFVRGVLDDVARRFCVAPDRVYAVGFSGGGRLASQLACTLADRLAGVAAVGGLRHPERCEPIRPVPILAFHGTMDPINPYVGGGPDYWGAGVEDALRGWAAENGCPTTPVLEPLSAQATRVTYCSDTQASRVTLYRLDGAGHVWPGSAYSLPRVRFGASVDRPDATAVMLQAFGLTTEAPTGPVSRSATAASTE